MINESVQKAVQQEGFGKKSKLTYTSKPTPEQLDDAAELVNQGSQLVITLDGQDLAHNATNIVALDGDKVVGIAAIKPGDKQAAEIGYLMVDPDHRRQGIAKELGKRQFAAGKKLGLGLLYASIRQNNKANRANREKQGMIHVGDKKSPYSSNILSYYAYPLRFSKEEAFQWVKQSFDLPDKPKGKENIGQGRELQIPQWLEKLLGEREKKIARDPDAYVQNRAGDPDLGRDMHKIISPQHGEFIYNWKTRKIVG